MCAGDGLEVDKFLEVLIIVCVDHSRRSGCRDC